MNARPAMDLPVRIPAEVLSLTPYVAAGVLGAVEVHLAAWVARSASIDDPLVTLAVAMAAWSARHGHACAALGELAEVVDHEQAHRAVEAGVAADVGAGIEWPEPAAWTIALRSASSGAVVRVVDGWDTTPVLDPRPLVLHGDRVYLQRHWADECSVAASMRARSVPSAGTLTGSAAALFDQLLPMTIDGTANLQRKAAEVVLGNRLALVVGGPGTGKTYSVARLLAVLIDQALQEGHHLRVALAAPTGKAAARLQESITGALTRDEVARQIPAPVRAALAALEPSTIHRLLGPLGDRRQRFRHDDANPLPHDVVVIDETSMVSLPLLARLCEAVRPDARLVLIGDPDQLESVELGAVLGDLVAASGFGGAGATGPLAGRVERLVRSHRFGTDSPIARLADAVRDGDGEAAVEVLNERPVADAGSRVRFVETGDPRDPTVVAHVHDTIAPVLAEVLAAAEAGDAEAALSSVARARILCAHRLGPHGVAEWNQWGERWMCGAQGTGAVWYSGRPLLATRNDPRLGLSNGDTGVMIRRNGRLVAAFNAALGIVTLDPVRLEDVETAYAMTVHKSQGSEYPIVVMVLPPPTSPLIGRELIYTGVTRAQHDLLVVGSAESVRRSAASPARRMTGLADALRH